ncbi:unnamed protein product, partial [Mesorhabditis belari]|uniref:Uncharacterized protein n=1 Tax=Mesorhabditis belari TaxID=2138241 RepID=A0AAF3F8C4_9BILA
MASWIGLLLLLGTSIAQFRPPTYQSCDGQRLNQVQAAFNDALGITPNLGVKTYEQLRMAVEGVWARTGIPGLSSVCNAFKGIKVGFNKMEDYEACFFATGITMAQAIGYQKLMNQFDFACGAGFSVFANVDVCAAGIFGSNATKTQLNQCQSDFASNVANDPTNVCTYAATAALCYQTTFMSCGRSAGWWGCEYERMGTATYYPHCTQNFCTLNPVQ